MVCIIKLVSTVIFLVGLALPLQERGTASAQPIIPLIIAGHLVSDLIRPRSTVTLDPEMIQKLKEAEERISFLDLQRALLEERLTLARLSDAYDDKEEKRDSTDIGQEDHRADVKPSGEETPLAEKQ